MNISTWAALNDIRNDLAGSYTLTRDLLTTDGDYTGIGSNFTPIGTSASPFTGSFDGAGFKIQGLIISKSYDRVGLFGETSSGSTISNVSVVSASVTGLQFTGAIVGVLRGSITNCYSSGTVNASGSNYGGGLVGFSATGSVSKCWSSASVSANGVAGGLVGENNSGSIADSYAIGPVNVTSAGYCGGLVGLAQNAPNTIDNSYSTGAVTGSGGNLGGLIGGNSGGTFTDSFWDTQTSGQATSAGGTGKTTIQMTTQSTFSGAGWDFSTPIWYYHTALYPELEAIVDYAYHENSLTQESPNKLYQDISLPSGRATYPGIDTYTKLMLHCDGVDGSKELQDSSGTNKIITQMTNATLSGAQYKFGRYSGLFDAGYYSIPYSADFNFNKENFCIDFWIYPTALSATGNTPINSWTRWEWDYGQYTAWSCNYGTSGVINFAGGAGGSNFVTSGNLALVINQWQHVAIVRKGTGATDLNIYINGVAGNAPATGDVTLLTGLSGTAGITIGHMFAANHAYFKGYLDEIRVSKGGDARWITGFATPTAPYETDNWTKLLLHMESADTSGTYPKIPTFVGTAQIDTAQSVFGGASVLFDGNSDSVYFPHNTDFNLSSSDFTIDFWLKTSQTTANATIFSRTPGTFSTGMWSLLLNNTSSGTIAFFANEYSPTLPLLITAGSLANTNAWVHVAVVRYGNVWTIYVNGVSKATRTTATTITDITAGVYIAQDQYYLRWYNGWIDEFRFSKGVARWTSDFLVPTEAYAVEVSSASNIKEDVRFAKSILADVRNDIRIGSRTTADINQDARICKAYYTDLNNDVRFKFTEVIKDANQDIRIGKSQYFDWNNDVRFGFEILSEDNDVANDVRISIEKLEDLNQDVRLYGSFVGDLNGDIRYSKLDIKDFNQNIITHKEIAADFNADIRTQLSHTHDYPFDARFHLLIIKDVNQNIAIDKLYSKDFFGNCVPQKDSIKDFYCDVVAVTQTPVYVPNILSATDMQKGDLVKVAWSADSNYGYNVYRTAPGGRLKMNPEPVVGLYELLVGDLTENTAYTFVVVGVNAGGTESADSLSKTATPTYPSVTGPNRIKRPTIVVSVAGVPRTDIILDTVEDAYGTTPTTATFKIPTNDIFVTTPTFNDYVTVTVNSRVIFKGYIQRIERDLSSSGKTVTYTAYSGITSYNNNFTSWGWIKSVKAQYYGLDITDQTELQAWETIWNSEGNYKVYYDMNGGGLQKYRPGSGSLRSVTFGKNIISFNIYENRLDQINRIVVRGGPTKWIHNYVPVLFEWTNTEPSFLVLTQGGYNVSDVQLQAYQTVDQPNIQYDNTISVIPSDVGLARWEDGTVEPKQKVTGWSTGKLEWTGAGSQIDYNYRKVAGEEVPHEARISVTTVARVIDPVIRGYIAKREARTTSEGIDFGFVSVALPNTWKGAAYRMAYTTEDSAPPETSAGGGTPARSITDGGLAGVRDDREGTDTTGQMAAARQIMAQGELDKVNDPQISGRITIIGDETMGLRSRVNINGIYLDIVRVVHNFSNGYTTELELSSEKFRVNVDTQVARLRKVRVERKVKSLEAIAQDLAKEMGRNSSTQAHDKAQDKDIPKGPYALYAD